MRPPVNDAGCAVQTTPARYDEPIDPNPPPSPLAATNAPPPRYLVGCVLAFCAPIAAFLAAGAVFGVTAQLVDRDPTVPHPIVLALLSGLTLGGLSALFVLVSKRLYAAYRGVEVPHLMPVWLSVILAAAIGLAGLASLIFSAQAGSVSGAGASVVFIAYAFATTRKWLAGLRNRRRSAAAGEAAPPELQ